LTQRRAEPTAGQGQQRAGEQDEGNSLCLDTKASFEYAHDGKNRNGIYLSRMRHVGSPLFAAIVCRKFATVRLSLGICRITKMSQR